MTRTSTSNRVVLAGVVAGASPRRGQQDAQHLRVALRGPEREDVEAGEHQQAGQERVEEIERRGAHAGARGRTDGDRRRRPSAGDAAPCRRVGTSGDRHDASPRQSLVRSVQNNQVRNCAGEQREAAAEHDAGDLAFGAAFSEHEHQSADDDRDERERARERSGEREREIVGRALPRRLLRERDARREEQSDRDERSQSFVQTRRPIGRTLRPPALWLCCTR